ncbi:hypothetical protein J3R03_004575 [Actinoplanes couchii]|nr:hypothetical protein [Actinoplanes couchii]
MAKLVHVTNVSLDGFIEDLVDLHHRVVTG